MGFRWFQMVSGTLALIHNRYDIFTTPQLPAAKLLEKQWQILQHIMQWIQPTAVPWS